MSAKGSANAERPLFHLRVHPDVTNAIAKQPEHVRVAVKTLVDALRLTPRSRDLGVLPGKALPWPNIYTAPIGPPDNSYGILTYQVYADHPAIHLFKVLFWEVAIAKAEEVPPGA